MARLKTDILISGGGVAGLTAAAAFGTAGYDVVLVEPNPPVTDLAAKGADLRTTAFLMPSVEVLRAAGLWDRLAPFATALQIMRIIDAGGADNSPRLTRDFDAAEITDRPFGWNLPNWLLRREMVARLSELHNVTFVQGQSCARMVTRETQAIVTLSGGDSFVARLAVAADGRHSTLRAAAGISVKTTKYNQKALVFAVSHPQPHDNISTEIHRTGGPFTLVPLPDQDGTACSSVVWMERSAEADRLAALNDADFSDHMNQRSCGIMGDLTLISRRSIWPMMSQIADTMFAQRTALIAEAAHVVPPIGAQGLNMSLADIGALLSLATPENLGQEAMLRAYHKARYAQTKARVLGIDALNRASMVTGQMGRDLRMTALETLYRLSPIRKTLMKTGLGLR
jgi:2-octaprenyl-6-methoxyphenol hydroxylase